MRATMGQAVTAPVRFRFAEFVLSPRQRLLVRGGVPVSLIPKYFDLLLLLIIRRRDAVSKHTIFSEVWSDVVVSDGALSQAVRTLRRTLDDDSRDPRFIRTVSRHGYQFVFPDLIEEADEEQIGQVGQGAQARQSEQAGQGVNAASLDSLIDRLLRAAAQGSGVEAEARDLAEQLHALGTADAVARLTSRPRHGPALALMREARWTVAGSGDVPLLGDREGLSAVWGRIFFLYGAHEHPSRLVPSVINALLDGKPALCTHGNQIRDFLHVEDVASAFAALLDSEVNGAVNIASGEPVALENIIYRIADKLERPDLVQLDAISAPASDVPLLIGDASRLKQEVGWSPRYDLDTGLEMTIDWWKRQKK